MYSIFFPDPFIYCFDWYLQQQNHTTSGNEVIIYWKLINSPMSIYHQRHGWKKGKIDLQIGFKENFHFKILLENKCHKRNREFQCFNIITLKISQKKTYPCRWEAFLYTLFPHIQSEEIFLCLPPQKLFTWQVFQFYRCYYQDKPVYHYFLHIKAWLNLEHSWEDVLLLGKDSSEVECFVGWRNGRTASKASSARDLEA